LGLCTTNYLRRQGTSLTESFLRGSGSVQSDLLSLENPKSPHDLTLDSTHRLKSGPILGEAITEIDAQTGLDAPDYYLVNCSHPLEYEPALDDGAWTRRLRGVRPNASKMEKIALCKLDHLEDGNPVELATQLSDLHARYPHMDIFGGCCGTGDEHLREIAKALRPSLY